MGCIRTGTTRRWPGGVIPFTINAGDFPDTPNQVDRLAIAAAITHWQNATNIRFQQRTNEFRYVEFVKGDDNTSCHSHVGMVPVGGIATPGPQRIYCNPTKKALRHEIGHAIGLWHEQSREDRDAFITIHRMHITSDKASNLDRHVGDGTVHGVYDYNSIMHYYKRTFAVDWQPAVPLPDQASQDGPAIAVMTTPMGKEQLHLVHRGESSSDFWHSWTEDGLNWTPNTRIAGQKSKLPPALAGFKGKLHMVHLGESSNTLWRSTFDGNAWTPNQPIAGQKSKVSPALAVFSGKLHMVHLGDSSDTIYHSWSNDGMTWTANQPIAGQKSRATPALAEFRGKLHMAFIGESSATIWHSTFDGTDWSENDRHDNNRSRRGPALANFDGKLYSVHLGESSDRIWRTVRDETLVIFDRPATVTADPGSTPDVISPGDVAAVNAMYP